MTERPRVWVGGGRALYVGPGLALSPHENAVATLAIGIGGPFELTVGPKCTVTRFAVIPPGTCHHLRATGAMAFAYVDPLRDDWPSLDSRRPEGLDDRVARLAADPSPAHLAELLVLAPRPPTDDRLAATMRAIAEAPRQFPRIEPAARHAGLSVSRFQHRFRETAGLPFRRFRLWARMTVIARVLERGGSLTDGAYEAGFASSAHFSAAFRRMFGLAPSTLIKVRTTFSSTLDVTVDGANLG